MLMIHLNHIYNYINKYINNNNIHGLPYLILHNITQFNNKTNK